MTRQTSEPVREIPMGSSARAWGDLIHQLEAGDISYDMPYQRGDVWTYDQRIALIFSILSGTPVPALILNDRPESMWFAADGSRRPIYAVIDGKQRLTAVQMFIGNQLLVPASWFPAERVEFTEVTDDGPYVRYEGPTGWRSGSSRTCPLPWLRRTSRPSRPRPRSISAYNGGGTAQTPDDMARAERIANPDRP